MKKNYFFGALMSLAFVLFAFPAKAQVASLTDLFGTYQFTADVTIAEGMETYADQISGDCEAVISKGDIYDAQIVGFAGAAAQMNINAISTEKEMIKVTNPNNPQLWSSLYLANENGDYPYGVWDNTLGEWTVESYGPVYMTYDPTTKLITIPDFTVVTCDHANSKATVVAEFTNAKMTLKQSIEVEVADLSGAWHATPLGTYGSNKDSEIPGEYDFVLTKTGDDNKNYTAELTIGDFAPVTLPATFDGVSLAIHAKDVVLDATTGTTIYYYGSTEYDITFSYASENVLSMSSPLCIGVPTVTEDENGEPVTTYEMVQWYMDGTAKRAVEGEAFDWAGTWTVKGTEAMAFVTTEFDMVVSYVEAADMYLITNFLGYDVTSLNYGGILLTPSADGKSAEIKTGTYLNTIEAGVSYLSLFDSNIQANPITVTVNEDGTLTIADFSVVEGAYGAAPDAAGLKGYYTGMTASKAPEVEPFDWTGVWTVKAGNVMSYDGKEYPAEFEMEVTYNEAYDMYLVTKFMSTDVSAINYGGILLSPAADNKSAELNTGTFAGGAYPDYLKMYDMNATTSPLAITVNEDGSLSIANFFLKSYNYDTQAESAAVYYQNVTATKGAAEEKPEVEPFDWTGVWTVKSGNVMSYDGKEYPAEFEMEVTYNEAYDMYLVTKFMSTDVSAINYGGILLSPAADNKSAELNTGTFAGGAYPDYLKMYDMNATTSPLAITVNEDGSLSIANFFLKSYNYDTQAESAAVYYQNVTATKGASSIDAVEATAAKVSVNGGVITIAGGAKAVQVYDAAGRLEFAGVTSSVANLAKGIHIVKVGGATVKIAVK